jgi:hypothetical protein
MVIGCASPETSRDEQPEDEPVFQIHTQTPARASLSADERYCAWYGEASGGVLYFGQSAFWSSYRAAGNDPRADLERPGPRPIGRFDLNTRQFLSPLETGPRPDGSETRSGVWDVLPLAGRIYFTTFFEEAGFVDLETGDVHHFEGSRYWNELALGPVSNITHGVSTTAQMLILVTRYADDSEGGGAVLVIDPDGSIVARYPIEAPPGVAFAPKTPAWDPALREIWVTTDRFPDPPRDDENAPFGHPTLVFDVDGREVARFGSREDPIEIQFVRFNHQGMGYLAASQGSRLELLILEPNADRRNLRTAPRVLLDANFAPELDFAQDIQIGPDGTAFVTRWSGKVHEVNPMTRTVRTWTLPRDDGTLYYTAVPGRANGSICATRCGDVEIVCASPSADRTR